METLLLVREERTAGGARRKSQPASMSRRPWRGASWRSESAPPADHEGVPLRFRYSPSAESAALIAEVAAAYRSHLVSMTTFIHSMAPASVREFASGRRHGCTLTLLSRLPESHQTSDSFLGELRLVRLGQRSAVA